MRNTADPGLDELGINTMRLLAVDTVQQANSGYPGTPMGAAPLACLLWDRFLKQNQTDPEGPHRDRFILSPGRASTMLGYSTKNLGLAGAWLRRQVAW